jgi:hypothetical protein
MIVPILARAPLAGAILCNTLSTNISSLDIAGKEFSDLKIAAGMTKKLSPLRRGAEGNDDFDDLRVSGMRENDSHCTLSRTKNRGLSFPNLETLTTANIGTQGQVA